MKTNKEITQDTMTIMISREEEEVDLEVVNQEDRDFLQIEEVKEECQIVAVEVDPHDLLIGVEEVVHQILF